MKSLINFRTAILCCACCLCSLSVNAQEDVIVIDFGNPLNGNTTGSFFDGLEENQSIFETTLNADMISNSNVLLEPEFLPEGVVTTFMVPEAGDAGLEITLVNATSTTGIDSDFGVGAELFVTGLGIALRGTPQRGSTGTDIRDPPFDTLESSTFRLDATHDEFLTFSFNQDVTVTAIGVANLSDGETFQFGPAENITNLSNMDLPDLTMGTFAPEGPQNPASSNNLMRFTFETPLQFAAGEEILVGETGNDPAFQLPSTPGVGFERIFLTIDEDGGEPEIVLGDVNQDGIVNFLDISPFIGVLSAMGDQAEADVNEDGIVNFLDISVFINILTSAGS